MAPMPSKTRLAGSGTALMPLARAVSHAVIRQHDRQVVDVHLAVGSPSMSPWLQTIPV